MFMCAEKYKEIPVMGRIRIANEKTDDINNLLIIAYDTNNIIKLKNLGRTSGALPV